jgi:predicted transposase YdaD
MSEIFMYLRQYKPQQDWQAVAIFARRSYDPGEVNHFRELYASNRIVRVYLEDWLGRDTRSWAIRIVQLIVASKAKTPELVKQLFSASRAGSITRTTGGSSKIVRFVWCESR